MSLERKDNPSYAGESKKNYIAKKPSGKRLRLADPFAAPFRAVVRIAPLKGLTQAPGPDSLLTSTLK